MREVRHITVAVSPELYRQTRRLAADYDTTVSAIVAGLLQKLPQHLKYAPPGAGASSKQPRPENPAVKPESPVTPSTADTSTSPSGPGTATVRQ